MIIFNVVKEQHGWSVRMGEQMTTPFWSKDLAVWEANRLADGIRRHGELTEVIVEGGYTQVVTRQGRHVKPRQGVHLRSGKSPSALNTYS